MTALEHDGRPEHVPGEWRDLPRTPGGYHPHTPVEKSKGLDWDALTPKCSTCGQPSGQLRDSRCPPCRGEKPVDVFATGRTTKTAVTRSTGVTSTYDQLDDDQITRRFTPETSAPDVSRDGGRSAAGAEVEAARQPATPPNEPDATPAYLARLTQARQHTRETTVTSPPFPTYIVDIAVVMRDSEHHDDPAVRTARKAVANALVALNRELTRVGSPAASTSPDGALGSARHGALHDHGDDIVRRYRAGESTLQLAERYGVHNTTIGKLLHRRGVTMRPAQRPRKTTSTNPTGDTAA